MKGKAWKGIALAAALMMCFGSPLTASALELKQISIAGAGTAGTFYIMAAGIADLFGQQLGVDTVATPADALEWHLLPLYGRAWTAGEAAKAYAYSKSLMARRGVTLA